MVSLITPARVIRLCRRVPRFEAKTWANFSRNFDRISYRIRRVTVRKVRKFDFFKNFVSRVCREILRDNHKLSQIRHFWVGRCRGSAKTQKSGDGDKFSEKTATRTVPVGTVFGPTRLFRKKSARSRTVFCRKDGGAGRPDRSSPRFRMKMNSATCRDGDVVPQNRKIAPKVFDVFGDTQKRQIFDFLRRDISILNCDVARHIKMSVLKSLFWRAISH